MDCEGVTLGHFQVELYPKVCSLSDQKPPIGIRVGALPSAPMPLVMARLCLPQHQPQPSDNCSLDLPFLCMSYDIWDACWEVQSLSDCSICNTAKTPTQQLYQPVPVLPNCMKTGVISGRIYKSWAAHEVVTYFIFLKLVVSVSSSLQQTNLNGGYFWSRSYPVCLGLQPEALHCNKPKELHKKTTQWCYSIAAESYNRL